MATSTLLTMKGTRLVSRAELDSIPAPPATASWFPLSHATVLTRVGQTLTNAGFRTRAEKLAVSRGNARFFGTLDLESEVAPGVGLAVGVRNSTDKSLPIGFCCGHRVFVCDNLAFRSEVTIARKHTKFGETRFGEALCRAVGQLQQFREAEALRIRRFRETPVSEERADSVLLHAYEEGIVSHRQLPGILRAWRRPSHEDFRARSLWSLLNAFTAGMGAVQRANPQRFAALTMRLQHFLAERTKGGNGSGNGKEESPHAA